MTSPRIPLADAPDLPAELSQLLLREALDLVLVLDDEDRVINECHSPEIDPAVAASLLDLRLVDILSIESRGKLGSILRSNSLIADAEYRWRHINLVTGRRETLPVLAKYIELEAHGRVYRALLCRDLSSIDGINRRLAQVQLEHDREIRRYQDEIAQLAMKPWLELVGKLPLHEISSIMSQWIERDCIRLAMEESGQDRRAAALLLGMSSDDLEARLRQYTL